MYAAVATSNINQSTIEDHLADKSVPRRLVGQGFMNAARIASVGGQQSVTINRAQSGSGRPATSCGIMLPGITLQSQPGPGAVATAPGTPSLPKPAGGYEASTYRAASLSRSTMGYGASVVGPVLASRQLIGSQPSLEWFDGISFLYRTNVFVFNRFTCNYWHAFVDNLWLSVRLLECCSNELGINSCRFVSSIISYYNMNIDMYPHTMGSLDNFRMWFYFSMKALTGQENGTQISIIFSFLVYQSSCESEFDHPSLCLYILPFAQS